MVCVLVTRPQETAETTAASLQELGYQPLIEPLLSIAPVKHPRPIGRFEAVMITSANALSALEGRQEEIADLLDMPCFCVGDRTAEEASLSGFRKGHSAEGSGADLARLIGAAFGGRPASLLHIAGRDVSGVAQRELEKKGHRVTVWPVYEAIPAKALTATTRLKLEGGNCDAVLLYSPRSASVFKALLGEDALKACCARVAAICLSEGVADILRPLEWGQLAVAPQPTETAMIACLQKARPAKK